MLLRGGVEMAVAHVERLDHLGLITAVIKDLGLIDSKYSVNPFQQDR
jgi:hypothetical protein